MGESRKSENNSYRSMLKGTSLFGGVQVFQLLITTVRSKFVAAILGPAGWGVSGLFSTSATTLSRTCSLGLNVAIVKEIAHCSDDDDSVKHLVCVARRLLLWTALFGALVCLFFSRLLSLSTFDSTDYTVGFMLLSLYVFFTIAGNGEQSILQGLREAKRLTHASIIGSVTGLVIGVPMYYLWGVNGIVPAMCVLGVVLWAFFRYSVRKSIPERLHSFSWSQHSPLVKRLVAIGLVLMSADIIGSFTTYLAQIFIRHFSDLATVGLYTSATMMTNQYSSVVFTAMSMDYLPRLSKVSGNNEQVNIVVNRQTEIVALIITPVVTLFILCAPLVIYVLLTSEFMTALPLMRWMALGITFKALMYPLGYIAFAKDNRKLFFWLEGITGNFLTLALSCVFFYFFGLVGLGYAMVADGICCLILYYIINHHYYGYQFDKRAARGALIAVLMSICSLGISYEGDSFRVYAGMAAVAVIASLVSIMRLRTILKSEKNQSVDVG